MRALISVYDKSGIVDFVGGLHEMGIDVVATDGTYEFLRENGVEVQPVTAIVDTPDLLAGQVKTLHPEIFAAIMADRSNAEHNQALDERGIKPIDIVVVNLFPFVEVMSRPGSEADPLDYIDIGGVALIRAAAKAYHDVTVVVSPDDYEDVLSELYRYRANREKTRLRLASKAFAHAAAYDSYITSYFAGLEGSKFPASFTVPLFKIQDLRYGENLHQQAALYSDVPPAHGLLPPNTVANAEQIHGKESSFNNILDVNAAWSIATDYTAPAVAIVKHSNPTGIAAGKDLSEAFTRAFQGDPAASYGGIIGVNRTVDGPAAEEMVRAYFEAIIAPDFTAEAVQALSRKKAIRLLSVRRDQSGPRQNTAWIPYWDMDFKRIGGGFLIQTPNRAAESSASWQVVSKRQPTLEELTDLQFAWRAVKHVTSNAVILAKKLAVIGVGAGQVSRLNAVELAVRMAGDRSRGSVLASDAYFSFVDGVERAIGAGVTAIVQPGGSIRDRDIIDAVDKAGLAMIFTGLRQFRQ